MQKNQVAQALTKIVPFELQRRILGFLIRIALAVVKTPTIQFAGTTVYLSPGDRSSAHIFVSHRIWGRWNHESFQQALVNQLIRVWPDKVVFIDGGASFGMYSLLAAQHENTRAVMAIEADPDTFGLLEKTVAQSPFAPKLRCVNAALVDKGGRSISLQRIGEANSEWTQVQISDGQSEGHAQIPGMTVLDILDGLELRQTDLAIIKLDIEGSEPLAVAGFKSFLESARDTVVFIEFHVGVLNRFDGEAQQFATELWNTNMAGIYSINEREQTLESIDSLEMFLKLTSNLEKQAFPHNLTNLLLTKKPLPDLGAAIRKYRA